ncbi:MAG: VOC family protein, partial [Litorivicinaceae bacterium]
SFNLVLAKPGDEDLIGRQAGRRVFIFIDTVDLDADLARFRKHDVQITDGPRTESFGRCVLVTDLVGNSWEFVERV